MGFNIFIRCRRKADPLLGVFSANLKMSSTRQTKASNSYRLVPRTTGANTVQQNCWKVSGFRLIKEKGNPVKLRSDEANRLEPGVDFAVENTARNTPGCKTSGAFHCTKISGNFGPNINGTVRPRWKFSGKSGPPPEVVLFDRSVQSDRKLPLHFLGCFFFQSRSSSSLHPVIKMEDGSDVNVYECSACQTQDLNFLLMHSCTQGSGTAVHLNLFFLLIFISF